MLVRPSSQRTRNRCGCSLITSSIRPARPDWLARSDSTLILSPTWTVTATSFWSPAANTAASYRRHEILSATTLLLPSARRRLAELRLYQRWIEQCLFFRLLVCRKAILCWMPDPRRELSGSRLGRDLSLTRWGHTW
jgi:hypothetical protein